MSEQILIVGGSQGIGAALAAAYGDRATAWSRRTGVDATNPASLRAALATFQSAYGAPKALIHTIGDFAEQPLLATDFATYHNLFQSNVESVFHTVQTVIPAMIAAKRPGRVVLFAAAGVDGHRGMLRAPVYFAAKAAVVQFARSLAAELSVHRITVNVIAPGLIHHANSHHESQRRMLARVPAGRLGTGADILAAVQYLLSGGADYVTGQVLTVDGGLHG